MAKTLIIWRLTVLFMAMSSFGMAEEKKMMFYMHDVVVGSNRTAVPVNIGSITRLGFGAIVVIDDILTESSNPNSTRLGRAKGMYVSDSLDLTQPDVLLLVTVIFEEPPEYRGSTLCIHGADTILKDQREVAIVGGTGKFRYARGSVVISTIETSLVANAVLQFNITFRMD
ncbi:hypothetical protein SUGI_0417920 [Cryptomeria japonica]|uniref:dirigent protein 15 n=1 Tax=Cryptomeria japonica TaxID=3369 RepID=UPI002408B449|nr:dirigent protein 15 [Cryptomeria japonica]GLJ22232.1 hypothetical protein SUGI_0417920 [Cryptomeria japonica]